MHCPILTNYVHTQGRGEPDLLVCENLLFLAACAARIYGIRCRGRPQRNPTVRCDSVGAQQQEASLEPGAEGMQLARIGILKWDKGHDYGASGHGGLRSLRSNVMQLVMATRERIITANKRNSSR